VNDFPAFLADFSEATPMPLFHSTSSYNFRAISQAASADLTPTHCPVFNEDLLYFFYGRPAYRVSDHNSDTIAYAPVCFIIKPDVVMLVERVFPFDTGAFHHGRFAQYVHESMTKDSFQLGSDLTAARKAITAFFGSCRRYYLGQLSPTLAPSFSQMELATYVQIVKRPLADIVDDRRYSIEVQTRSSIALIGNTLAVVLPYEAMEDSAINTFVVKRLGAQPIPYSTALGIPPADFRGEIRVRVQQFLERGSYL
jgi:hypothetical protein